MIRLGGRSNRQDQTVDRQLQTANHSPRRIIGYGPRLGGPDTSALRPVHLPEACLPKREDARYTTPLNYSSSLWGLSQESYHFTHAGIGPF